MRRAARPLPTRAGITASSGTYNSVTLGTASATTDADTAAAFNGSSSYVDLGSPSALKPSSNAFAVEAWFKTSSTSAERIYRWSGDGVELQLTSGQLRGVLYNSSGTSFGVTSSATYDDNVWHHAVFSWDGAVERLYVDGTQVAINTPAAGTTVYYGSGGGAIGRDGNNSAGYFSGSIDDVAFYSKALSSSSVKAHYDSGVPHYSYAFYDPNGNETMVSQETSATSASGLSAAEKTTTSYLDLGSIYKTTDGTTGLSIRYDYTPEGWQFSRWPDGTGTPGFIDYSRAMYTDYLPGRPRVGRPRPGRTARAVRLRRGWKPDRGGGGVWHRERLPVSDHRRAYL